MESLVSQGMPLALFGIGIVFVFLCLLVLATRAMSILSERFGPTPGLAPAEISDYPAPPAQVAVIVAAVTLHRKRMRAQGCALPVAKRIHS